MVVNICNPNYVGGRGKRITSLSAAWAKLAKPYLKNKIQTKRMGVWLKR
jgi:hypothetical protein